MRALVQEEFSIEAFLVKIFFKGIVKEDIDCGER
jgi:hypothetical protein